MRDKSLKKIFDTLKSLSNRLDNHSEVLKDHAEKIDTLDLKYAEHDEILNGIHENLIKINESLNSVLTLTSSKTPIKDAEPVPTEDNKSVTSDTDRSSQKKSGGGIAGIVAFTLFAIFPAVLQWIKEKREKISEFLNPVFEFIFEGVIPFFTERLPKFFMEDIPKYFSEKFDVVKDFATDFMGDIKKVMAGIQKTVGETIISLSDKMPNWDFLKTTKDSLKKYGTEMVTSADATIKEVDEEQTKTQAKRENKKRMDILLKQADEEGKRVVEVNKAKGYKGYEVKPNFEKGLVTIEYEVDGTDGVSQAKQDFDANRSMETGTLVQKNNGQPTPVKGDNGGTIVKGEEAQPVQASNAGAPISDASDSTNQTSAESEQSTASPEMAQGTANKGNVLDSNSKENESPTPKPRSSAPPVVTMPSTGQKVRMLPGQGPHDINDVPDPTPFLGVMANQLFYRSA